MSTPSPVEPGGAGWREVVISEIAEVVGGSTPKTSVSEYWDGDIPWVTPADLSKLDGHFIGATPRNITSLGLANSGAKVLPAGSVLLSSRAPIGHVAVTTVPMATNQGFKSLVPDPAQVDAKYLYWWLRTNKTYLQNLGNGATFKEVSKVVVSNVRVPLPPLPEQLRIADILDRADDLRAKRRHARALLDETTDALFAELTTESESLERVSLGSLVDIRSKLVDPRLSDYSSLPLIGADSIESITGRIIATRSAAEQGAISGKYLFERSAVLYSKIRPALNKVALPDFDGLCSADMYPLTINSTVATRDFVAALLRSQDFLAYAGSQSNRAQMPKLNRAQLLAYELRLPKLARQSHFAKKLSQVREVEHKNSIALTKLDELFASLQYRAFSGQL